MLKELVSYGEMVMCIFIRQHVISSLQILTKMAKIVT